ncbi:MAG TPA: nitronate monooxygenase family protein [Beijerinckiaceae bacterium]|nr:nitronate monooxygenase family protein [Beijerinckiaceae bacterium]
MTSIYPFGWKLKLPVIAAPMFLVSGPKLVSACMRAGIVGTWPSLNQRSTEGYVDWINEVREATRDMPAESAIFGVNLIVHGSNTRLQADVMATVANRVPLVITSLGAVKEIVQAVHSYGGKVFHDVTTRRHAEKAVEAGVDGLILVAAGAGGHAGTANPLALIAETRRFFAGPIALSGAMSNGAQVAAAIAAGADFAYMGTRFIATEESLAQPDYKAMITQASIADIVYTPVVSGVPASFMAESLRRAGLDPKNLPAHDPKSHKLDMASEAKAWRDVWSAGHGVADTRDIVPTGDLVARMRREFEAARARLSAY